MTIQSVVLCGGNHPVIFGPRQGPTCFRTIHLHVQLAAPFGAMRQTGLALFRTLESG